MTGKVNEFELIGRAFRRRMRFIHGLTRLGNGDDASIHAIPEHHELAISTDISVSGRHWPHDFPLQDAARRSVNAALSDLAAMGATPAWMWLGVMAKSEDDADQMGRGVAMALQSLEMELAGGDTVRASVDALSITVAGLLPQGSGMRRDAARSGEDVWLCGSAGLAAYGLQQWRQGAHGGRYVSAFRDVVPLLQEGARLRELGVECCIDVSDGLLADAGHIADASATALHLRLQDVPGFSELGRELGEDEASRYVLGGGEDYALLFTASSGFRQALQPFSKRIGECRTGKGVHVTLRGQAVTCAHKGYDHFA